MAKGLQDRMVRAMKLQVCLCKKLMAHRERLGQQASPDEFVRKYASKFRMKFEAGRYDGKYQEV